MSERKDEQWLDDQLRRVIDGNTPAFDAESWKRRHSREYEMLLARSEQPVVRRLRLIRGRWIIGLAAAAVIILGVAMLLVNEPDRPVPPANPVAKSSVGMMSMMSLRMAYEQGGFDALDRQLQSTLDEFGPRPSGVSVQELF